MTEMSNSERPNDYSGEPSSGASNPVQNPYHADYGDDVSSAPFAGRQQAFARLYQHLSAVDPKNAPANAPANAKKRAFLFMGKRRIGKTAFLRAAGNIVSDSFLPVYIALRETEITDETEWLLVLAQHALSEVLDRGMTLSRLSDITPPRDDPRAWFLSDFLPPLLGALRHNRRLLFMLDDIEVLANGVRSGTLPADTFAFLSDLMTRAPQIVIICTLDTAYEDDLPAYAPLLSINDSLRLTHLAPQESAWLLQAPVSEYYTVTAQSAEAAHRAAGGAPGLLQQFGYLMFRKWVNDPSHTTITPNDVKLMIPTVYTYGERDYQNLWAGLNTDERLTLTAISGMAYDDPIGKIDAPAIESWLAQTDYPLDLVAINAALRGLEYREAVDITPGQVKINAELLQMWLLEHARIGAMRSGGRGSAAPRESIRSSARLSERVQSRMNANAAAQSGGKRAGKHRTNFNSGSARLILLFALALLISTVILVISLTSAPRSEPNAPIAQPTVTLFQGP